VWRGVGQRGSLEAGALNTIGRQPAVQNWPGGRGAGKRCQRWRRPIEAAGLAGPHAAVFALRIVCRLVPYRRARSDTLSPASRAARTSAR
jgi:hypothetical protein